MGRIITVTNIKGGIGKTTTVVNIGAGLALMGARVLLVDVDAQGNLAMALGASPKRTIYEVLVDGARIEQCIVGARENLDLLAADDSLLGAQPIIARRADWSRTLEQALRPVKSAYDFILIDSPGSLTVFSVNALLAASELIVPTTIEHLSIRGLNLLFKQVARVTVGKNVVRLIVPTMFDPRRRQSTVLLEQLRATYGALVGQPIRVNVRLSEATTVGKTIYEFDARSRGALDYAQMVKRLADVWGFQRPVGRGRPATTNDTQPADAGQTPQQQNGGGEPAAHPLPPPPPPVLDETPPPVSHTLPTRQETPEPAPQPSTIPTTTPPPGISARNKLTCPHCGALLRRTTMAGYRVAYCEKCHYQQQELASGFRR